MSLSEDPIPSYIVPKLLDIKDIVEGMEFLGCIVDVFPNSLKMCLPGCIFGIVPSYVLDSFLNFDSNQTDEPSIFVVFKVGMLLPCKVIQVANMFPTVILLSIRPRSIYEKLSYVYPKMGLFVAAYEKFDGTYKLDAGEKVNVLMKSSEGHRVSSKKGKFYFRGIIPTRVEDIEEKEDKKVVLSVVPLSSDDDFPELLEENMCFSALHPGTKIKAKVVKVEQPFVYMTCMDEYYACAYVPYGIQEIKVDSSVLGTVLYIQDSGSIIFLMLHTKSSLETLDYIFELKMYSSVQIELKYICNDRAFYKIGTEKYGGFIHMKDDPELSVAESIAKYGAIPEAYVHNFHYLDNLVELTTEKTEKKNEYIPRAAINIGDTYEVVIEKHYNDKMIVSLSSEFKSSVPGVFLPDRNVEDAIMYREIYYPVGSKLTCRVVATDTKRNNIFLTCKPCFMNLNMKYALSSFFQARQGYYFQGVVLESKMSYVTVLFFNNIKGYSPSHLLPNTPLVYGQTVTCRVVQCLITENVRKFIVEIVDKPCDIEDWEVSDTDELGLTKWEREQFNKIIIRQMKRRGLLKDEEPSPEPIEEVVQVSEKKEKNVSLPKCLLLNACDGSSAKSVKGIVTSSTDTSITIKFEKPEKPDDDRYCPNHSSMLCKPAISKGYQVGKPIDVFVLKKDNANTVVTIPDDCSVKKYGLILLSD